MYITYPDLVKTVGDTEPLARSLLKHGASQSLAMRETVSA